MITIREATNGAYMVYMEKCSDKDEILETEELVFSFNEDEPEQLVEMLYEIVDKFGCLGSKYSQKRINILIAPGENVESDKCPYCDRKYK